MACVVAAMPWTYWLAPPIFVATLLFLVGFCAWYLKNVVEPLLLRSDLARAATLAEALRRTTAASSAERAARTGHEAHGG